MRSIQGADSGEGLVGFDQVVDACQVPLTCGIVDNITIVDIIIQVFLVVFILTLSLAAPLKYAHTYIHHHPATLHFLQRAAFKEFLPKDERGEEEKKADWFLHHPRILLKIRRNREIGKD